MLYFKRYTCIQLMRADGRGYPSALIAQQMLATQYVSQLARSVWNTSQLLFPRWGVPGMAPTSLCKWLGGLHRVLQVRNPMLEPQQQNV